MGFNEKKSVTSNRLLLLTVLILCFNEKKSVTHDILRQIINRLMSFNEKKSVTNSVSRTATPPIARVSMKRRV